MRLSDPLEKAVYMAKENARRRGLHFLHPQYLIEAILQSLEDINREEQKSLMRANAPTKMRDGEWW